MEQFVLGDVAAGEGGMWLQGGSRWPCNPGSSLGLLLGEVCTCAPGQALLCKLQLSWALKSGRNQCVKMNLGKLKSGSERLFQHESSAAVEECPAEPSSPLLNGAVRMPRDRAGRKNTLFLS